MYNEENILILGGTGFIGKNIIHYLLHQNQFFNMKFFILSRDSYENIQDSIEFVTGDYSNKKIVRELFQKWNFTKVIHCATSTTPLSSTNNILNDINGNLIATIGLLDIMREFGCNYILYLSSGGAVYGEKNLKLISEKEICHPVSSYGVVKLTIENYLRLYQKQYGINHLILRVSNPFGQFHTSENQGIINIAIRRALQGQKIEIWGDGSQSKDYIFVEDLIQIIFRLIKVQVVNKIINVGSGESHQLNDILFIIKKHLPKFEVKYVESKSSDVKDFCLDTSLLKELVGFEFTNFEDSVVKTILFEKSKSLNNLLLKKSN
jgi:UDP-glucose 4-epimerase